jgi:hypothetical protein
MGVILCEKTYALKRGPFLPRKPVAQFRFSNTLVFDTRTITYAEHEA